MRIAVALLASVVSLGLAIAEPVRAELPSKGSVVEGIGWFGTDVVDNHQLKGSALGGELGLQFVRAVRSGITMTGTLGYRLARISPVEVSTTEVRLLGPPLPNGTLRNVDGKKAVFDLSGLFVRLGLNFHFTVPDFPGSRY